MPEPKVTFQLEIDTKNATKSISQFAARVKRELDKIKRESRDVFNAGTFDTSRIKELERALEEVNKELTKLQKQAKKAGDETKEIPKASNGVFNLSRALTAVGVAVAAVGLGTLAQGAFNLAKEGLQAVASFETLERTVTRLVARELINTTDIDNISDALNAANPRAQELLGWIEQLAIQSPFSQETVANAFRTALAYGFTTEEAQRLTQATLDLAAGSGAGAESLGRINLALGQIRTKGRVSAEELNQLTEAGFNTGAVLASLGVTLDDVSRGLVDADTFIEAAVLSLERDFGGAAKEATNTLQGLITSLGDLRQIALREFFTATFQELQPLLAEFAAGFEELRPTIRELGDSFGELVGELIPSVETLQGGISKLNDFLANTAKQFELINRASALIGEGDRGGSIGDRLIGDLEKPTDVLERFIISLENAQNEISVAQERLGGIDFDTTFQGLVSAGGAERAREILREINFEIEQLNISDPLEVGIIQARALTAATEELNNEFSGTNEELAGLAVANGKLAQDQVDIQRGLNATSDRLNAYAESLGLTVGETEQATQATVDYTDAAERLAQQQAETTQANERFNQSFNESIIELASLKAETDDTIKATLELAEARELNSEQTANLLVSLGLLTDAELGQAEATARARDEFNDLLTVLTSGEGVTSAQTARFLALAGVLGQDVVIGADAATSALERLNQAGQAAISGTASRLEQLVGRPTARGGGGRRVDTEELKRETFNDIKEIEEERAKAIAETQNEAAEKQEEINQRIAEKEQDTNERIADQRVKNEEVIEQARVDGLQRVKDLEAEIAQTRQAAIEQFNRELAQGFVRELDKVLDEQEFDPEAQAREILSGRAGAGVSASQLEEEAVLQGIATPEQARQAAAELERARGTQAIIDTVTLTPNEVVEATNTLNQQIDEIIAGTRDAVDLSEFGVSLLTADEAALEATRKQQEELNQLVQDNTEEEQRLRQEGVEKIAEIQRKGNEELLELQKESTEEIVKIQEASAEKIAEIQEKSADRIARAAEQLSTRLESANRGAAGSTRDLAREEGLRFIQAELLRAAEIRSKEERDRLIEATLTLAEEQGILTGIEADLIARTIELNEITGILAGVQGELNQAVIDGETPAENLAQKYQLVQSGLFDSAENAAALASVLTEQQVPAFIAAFEAGGNVRDILVDLGVKIDELPPEAQIAIESNADETIGDIDAVGQALSELDGQSATVTINEERTTTSTGEGQARAGGGGLPQFHSGGVIPAGRTAIVGDAPGGGILPTSEIVTPLSNSLVIPGDDLNNALRLFQSGEIPMPENFGSGLVNVASASIAPAQTITNTMDFSNQQTTIDSRVFNIQTPSIEQAIRWLENV